MKKQLFTLLIITSLLIQLPAHAGWFDACKNWFSDNQTTVGVTIVGATVLAASYVMWKKFHKPSTPPTSQPSTSGTHELTEQQQPSSSGIHELSEEQQQQKQKFEEKNKQAMPQPSAPKKSWMEFLFGNKVARRKLPIDPKGKAKISYEDSSYEDEENPSATDTAVFDAGASAVFAPHGSAQFNKVSTTAAAPVADLSWMNSESQFVTEEPANAHRALTSAQTQLDTIKPQLCMCANKLFDPKNLHVFLDNKTEFLTVLAQKENALQTLIKLHEELVDTTETPAEREQHCNACAIVEMQLQNVLQVHAAYKRIETLYHTWQQVQQTVPDPTQDPDNIYRTNRTLERKSKKALITEMLNATQIKKYITVIPDIVHTLQQELDAINRELDPTETYDTLDETAHATDNGLVKNRLQSILSWWPR